MEIRMHEDIKEKMMRGIDILAAAVGVTLGPRGRNVALPQKANLRGADYSDDPLPGSGVLITNDGVTIAKSIVLADKAENLGAQLLKEAAIKTNDTAGDGTTTATVLAQYMLHDAMRCVSAGANPVAVRRGMQKAAEVVAAGLYGMAKPVDTEKAYAGVAAVSCQDLSLGELVGEAYARVGREGVITVEDSGRPETSLEIQEGIVFDRGYLRVEMTNDEKHTTADMQDAYILLCDTKFTDPQDLLPVMILAAEDDKPLLVVSEGVEGSALGLVLKNRMQGDLEVVCVTAPLYGEGRRWQMEDIAVQTGGIYVSAEKGMGIRDVTREMLGRAARVRVTAKRTVITGGCGDAKDVQARINELKNLVVHTDYAFNRERHKERLARFVSGVAIIHAGGRTEPELQERKLRIEDAIHAVQAAAEEGIVSGGGIALLNTVPAVLKAAETLVGEERIGAQIVAGALRAPVRQIADNAGLDGCYMTEQLMHEAPGMGFDVDTGELVDMEEAGIMDPLRVTRLAFACAVSTAATVLTTEAGVLYEGKESR